MQFKSGFLVATLLGFLGCGQALAQLTVQITGELKQPACTPNLQRQLVPGTHNTSNTVTLPEVNLTALDAATKTAGGVQIQFRASGCTGNVNQMWVHFTSTNVDSNGRIIPTINNSYSNQLRFEIRNNSSSGSFIRVGGNAGSQPNVNQGTASSFTGSHPEHSTRVANKTSGVIYYAQSPVTQAGNYVASVTANFKYY